MNEFLKSFAYTDEETPLYIQLAGITYPDPTYRITRNASEVSVIEYVTDGEGFVMLDGRARRVSADTVYFLPRGEDHCYYADRKNPFTKIFLNVSGGLAEYLRLSYGLSEIRFFDGVGLRPRFEKILEAVRSDMSEFEMQASLQGIFVGILSALAFGLRNAGYTKDALKLKNYVDSHAERIVSTAELAEVIFRSPDYSQKLFVREFGITPYAYQLERKMKIARSLLADTQLPVGDIAERLGYGDIHYFSNLFYKKCGERPLAYRKSKHR